MRHPLSDQQELFNVWPSFTDIIIGIFSFVLFSFVMLTLQEYATVLKLKEISELVDQVNNDLSAIKALLSDEENKIKVEEGKITIQSDVLFPFDKGTIDDTTIEGRVLLSNLGIKLREFLTQRKITVRGKELDIFAIVVEGYTDDIGNEDYNQRLAFDRAQSVVTFWAQNGFSPNDFDITPAGLGELRSRLIVKTGSQTDQAPNRRIEIKILPKFAQLIAAYQAQDIQNKTPQNIRR